MFDKGIDDKTAEAFAADSKVPPHDRNKDTLYHPGVICYNYSLEAHYTVDCDSDKKIN